MTPVWNTLFQLTISGGAFVLLFLLAWPLARRLPARWRKLAWASALLFFLIPFSLPLPASVERNVEAAAPSLVMAALPAAPPESRIADETRTLDVREPLLLAWLAGAAFIGCFHLISWVRFSRAVTRRAGPAGETADNLCLRLSGELGLRRPPRLCRCAHLGAPMVMGVLRPRVLLPQDLSDEHLALVLRHELTHCKYRDTLWKLAALAVSTVHWWNPLAHVPRRMLEAQCELACDERLALSMDSEQRKRYGAAILDLASRGPVSYCAPFSRKRLLKKRLKTILYAKAGSGCVKAAGAALTAVLIAAGAAASSVVALAVGPSAAIIGGADGPTAIYLAGSGPAGSSPAAMTRDSLSAPAPIPGPAESAPTAFSLAQPVPGAPITVKYMEYDGHTGVDYSAPVGTPIFAAAGGSVTQIDYGTAGYGHFVLVDHGNGYRTRYAHCSEIAVNVGDSVAQGQQIASVGQTGNVVGPACRFELWKDADPVDPGLYLEGLS